MLQTPTGTMDVQSLFMLRNLGMKNLGNITVIHHHAAEIKACPFYFDSLAVVESKKKNIYIYIDAQQLWAVKMITYA